MMLQPSHWLRFKKSHLVKAKLVNALTKFRQCADYRQFSTKKKKKKPKAYQ